MHQEQRPFLGDIELQFFLLHEELQELRVQALLCRKLRFDAQIEAIGVFTHCDLER